MIQLTRLNHVPLILNSDLIEHIDVTPDTVIALTNGQSFLVRESPEEVVEKVVAFRQSILSANKSAFVFVGAPPVTPPEAESREGVTRDGR